MPIGVYVCHCGLNIAGVLNMEELKSFAEKLPDVAVAAICNSPVPIPARSRSRRILPSSS